MYKNTANQYVTFFVEDTFNKVGKTGDAANITATISIDGSAPVATNDVNPTEISDVNMPGLYRFLLTQAETNGNEIVIVAKSTTSYLTISPVVIYTETSYLGTGNTTVNHNTGGADNLAYKTSGGAGIEGAYIHAFLKTDYDAGNWSDEFIKGQTTTNAAGQWTNSMMLSSGLTYTVRFYKIGAYGPDTAEVTI